MNFVIKPGEIEPSAKLGGKAMALASLRQSEWPVPPWFVLRPSAFEASLGEAEARVVMTPGNRAALEATRAKLALSSAVAAELSHALAELCSNGEAVAVRSSALEEDGPRHSFAGQFESFLGVKAGDVAESIVRVWRSALSERALRYRQERGIRAQSCVPAVLIQRMVPAEAAGVAFSADPSSGRRSVAVVSAVYGLGSSLVNGESDADTWKLDRAGAIFARSIGKKQIRHAADSTGVHVHSIPESKRLAAVLTDEQVRAVALLVREVAEHFGRPQDIEWALHEGKVYLLQARPITTLRDVVDPDGPLRIWDNSNITESYSGVTTPLTFTFARRAYEGVYREFCRLLAVPRSKIVSHQGTFREMLGLVQGRVYYNLLNWYRVLALLPGFTFNRRFMEQMMGVKEPLPPALLEELDGASVGERVRDVLRLVWMCIVIAKHYLLLPRRIRLFQERLHRALQKPAVPLELQSAEELAAGFLELERKLLTRWDAPLLNDFFAMIFCGLLRRVAASWCEDADGSLIPALLRGQGDIGSSEPARRISRLARLAGQDEYLPPLMRTGSLAEIQSALERHAALKAGIESYLADFEDRCLGELKLESLTLRDDPLPLLRSIGRIANTPTSLPGPDPRMAAEQTVRQHLALHPLRRRLFPWLLRQTKACTRDRENLRFERTRLFARVRQIFVQLGQRLAADDHLAEARDVFYLEVDEVLGFLAVTATTNDLRGLVKLRQAEFARYEQMLPPPPRVTTRAHPSHGIQEPDPSPVADAGPELRRGLACSPGRVRGTVRVIRDPKHAVLQGGEILAAEHTDPGWVLLLPGARGLLVERGSLLSHSAIVARELRIPTIVGLAGLTRWLRDGDCIEMDGGTGAVRRLSAGAVRGVEDAGTSEKVLSAYGR